MPATGETASEAVRPAESEVVGFTGIVLQGSTDEATAFMRDLHASGISADSIYLDLLAPSARYLGELWTTERSDFVEVTVALHRLQDLAHKFSAYLRGMDDAETVLPAGPRALCVAMPGEQHVFGAQLVGEFLRRARWDVWDAPGATEPDIISLLAREWFTIVGISVSTLDQPEALAGLVRRVRRASSTRTCGSWSVVCPSMSIPSGPRWSEQTPRRAMDAMRSSRRRSCSIWQV